MTRAGRLHRVLKQLHEYANLTLGEAWKKIFKAEEMFTVYYMLERVDREVTLFEMECEEKGYDKTIYEPIVKQARAVIRYTNFEMHASVVHKKLPITTIERLYGISIMGSSEKDIVLDIDDDMATMKDALKEIGDKHLSMVLEEIIKMFENASMIAKINGAEGVREMIELIYCKSNMEFENIKQSPKEYIRSMISAYNKAKKAVNEAGYIASLPERISSFSDFLTNLLP